MSRLAKLGLGRRGARSVVICALAALGALSAAAVYVLDRGGAPAASRASGPPAPAVRDLVTMSDAQLKRLRELRAEALECMGWAAGNSFREPVWPVVESYVGQRGLYHDRFMLLAPPGAPSDVREAARAASFARYREAFLRGQRARFDAAETKRCIERTARISAQLGELLDEVTPARTLDSPISLE